MRHRSPAMMRSANRCRRLRRGLSNLTPRKENFFQEGKNRTEDKRGYANGDDSGIDQVRAMKLLSRLNHGPHTTIAIHNLGQNYVGPANIVENPERRKDSGK